MNVNTLLDPLEFDQPLRLDIGSGGISSTPGATSVDLYTVADIPATMWDIPLPDGCVQDIYSSNALEHVGKNQVLPTLKEWYRLLKVGGTLTLIVPDLEWACIWWLERQDTEWSMDTIYGNQNHDGEYHKTGFTPKILWNYFVATGDNWYIEKIEYARGEHTQQEIRPGVYHNEVTQRLISLEAVKA